ncbi:MAG: hypothetical protein IPH08_17645 [Rhodocyclaceae bacterium]|nr:hypothetical protein [Rhodocyclaceae bacterium]MBK6908821.1 hypothetical protein [Rhodocyclaceae bacterium]
MLASRSIQLSALSALLLCPALPAAAFSFADEEARDNAPVKRVAAAAIPAACKEKLKSERVLVLVAERGSQGFNADQERFGSHFMAIDKRLRKQGLRTFTPEEIRKVIAQAEIDAHFRNDPDAALNASKKMGASMTLRGVMSSRRSVNPMLKINEVAVNMSFNLIAADGHLIADAGASSDSYSGSDTASMALTLINEQADGVVNKLIRGYCSDGGK